MKIREALFILARFEFALSSFIIQEDDTMTVLFYKGRVRSGSLFAGITGSYNAEAVGV